MIIAWRWCSIFTFYTWYNDLCGEWWWLFSKPSFPFLISPSWFWIGKIRHADLAMNFCWEAVDIVIQPAKLCTSKNSWLDISLYNRTTNILLWSRYIYGQRYKILSYTEQAPVLFASCWASCVVMMMRYEMFKSTLLLLFLVCSVHMQVTLISARLSIDSVVW